MRIFLLPISTRRSLIYCEKLAPTTASVSSKSPASGIPTSASTNTPPAERYSVIGLTDKVVTKVNSSWAEWERSDSTWKRKLTGYGNAAFRRIPFEEWGLKTLPQLHKSTVLPSQPAAVLFPGSFLRESKVLGELGKMATERQAMHKRQLYYSLVGLPVTIPFGLIPILPNVPFLYLAFRAWSHYKALYGAKYLEMLLEKKLVSLTPSAKLDALYAKSLKGADKEGGKQVKMPNKEEVETLAMGMEEMGKEDEVMMLKEWNGQTIAAEFEMPEMQIEIERAVEQVERKLEQDNDKKWQEREGKTKQM